MLEKWCPVTVWERWCQVTVWERRREGIKVISGRAV